MYCMNCGEELPQDARVCPACGTAVGSTSAQAATGAPARHEAFEYARTTVKSDLATVTTDCYESLGFELTGSKEDAVGGNTALAFRRSRKIRGKAQLAKLQRKADDLIARIARLEASKTKRATAIAIATGVVSALVFGVGLCFALVWTDLMAVGIVVGAWGIAGCFATWLLYRRNVRKATAQVTPQIEATYDQLATVCEEAQSVLAVD